MQREQYQKLLSVFAESVTANLGKIQIDVADDRIRNELVTRKRNIAKSCFGITGRIDMIVLNTTRCCYANPRRFDERRQRTCNTETSASEVFLGQKDTMD